MGLLIGNSTNKVIIPCYSGNLLQENGYAILNSQFTFDRKAERLQLGIKTGKTKEECRSDKPGISPDAYGSMIMMPCTIVEFESVPDGNTYAMLYEKAKEYLKKVLNTEFIYDDIPTDVI